MALSSMLPPGYRAFKAVQQANQQGELEDLQKAGLARGLLAQMQAQKEAEQQVQQQEAFRGEIEALGTAPTQEQLAQVASRHVRDPKALLDIQQKSLDRQATVEASRDAARMRTEAARQAAEDRRDAAKQMIDLRYDTLAQQAVNEDQKRALEARRIADKATADKRHDDTLRLIASGNQDLRREIAANKPEKPLTEFQGRNVLFGTRSAQADKILTSLEERISLPGMAVAEALPGGNYVMSSEQRRVKQAQRDFVNAVLRQESGAVISDAEFANAQKQYFPAAGDDKATIAQKRANRKLAIKGFARLAGPGGTDVQAIIDAPLLPADEAAPAAGGAAVPPPPPGFQVNR